MSRYRNDDNMVGLNINMPSTCFECPCYQTLHLYNEKDMVQDTLVRRCAASKKVIKAVIWKDGDPEPDESWFDFTKPEWCPLIDLELKRDYVFMSRGKNAYEPYEEYEIWLKKVD